MENRVKFKIGEIEFEAEGSAEVIEREREIFLNSLLPAAVEAVKNTRGVTYQKQIIEASDNTPLLQAMPTDETTINLFKGIDFNRTSLSSFISNCGSLSEQDFVLFAAYYEELKAGEQTPFSINSVEQYYEEARRKKYSNNSELLRQLTIKGYIMDDPKSEKKLPKQYILTIQGIKYLEDYQPKQEEPKKPARAKKPRTKIKSTYDGIDVDTLNLSNYPEIKALKDFKEKMLMVMYIITHENVGEWFTVSDIMFLLTDIFGEPATIDQVNGVFKREKLWFKVEKKESGMARKLLNSGNNFAEALISKQ